MQSDERVWLKMVERDDNIDNINENEPLKVNKNWLNPIRERAKKSRSVGKIISNDRHLNNSPL